MNTDLRGLASVRQEGVVSTLAGAVPHKTAAASSGHFAAALLLPALLTTLAACQPSVIQEYVSVPGFVEPHTPGSGDPSEMAPTERLAELLGTEIDLNRVSYVRTAWVRQRGRHDHPGRFLGPKPGIVLILVPGLPAGAASLDPLARDLVAAFRSELEVWAIDRRPNQLEDRLGAEHAGASGAAPEALAEGAQFYFADTDVVPLGNFPGPEDLDINLDGVLDPRMPLPDASGVAREVLILEQDDARFMAHWGVDTYVRDWRILVEQARQRVGPHGLVLFGGHSYGTTWATIFAAYDFDPGPDVDAAHRLIDGLVLLEGGGVTPDGGFGVVGDVAPPADAEEYRAIVDALAAPGGPDVFVDDFVLGGVPLVGLQDLGPAAEIAALAGVFQPDEPALARRTPVLGTGLLSFVFPSPATNLASAGFFLDDDFQPLATFRASIGFGADGPNTLFSLPFQDTTGFLREFYIAGPRPDGDLRTWLHFDSPALPTCPPQIPDQSPGCAILDNGPPSDPDDPADPPRENGYEREVTDIDDLLRSQFEHRNGLEWYFGAGRIDIDLAFGNDSSALGDESLLAVTQNAQVDVPVLAIGGSNGLTPEPRSFTTYLDSIATPPADREVVILEGYAHLDVATARDNEAVPVIADWIARLRLASASME
jgi:hypothetical protein